MAAPWSTIVLEVFTTRIYEPTALERHAADSIAEAVDYLHRAQSMLDVAENALVEEEAQARPGSRPATKPSSCSTPR